MRSNVVSAFDPALLTYDEVNAALVYDLSRRLSCSALCRDSEVHWLLKVISVMDLTTLAGDDSFSNVDRLCTKARYPLSSSVWNYLIKQYDVSPLKLTTGAVCVYPYQVKHCVETLKRIGAADIPVASVATGFPSGQYLLNTRLQEITSAIENGATEIDIVINRTLALQGCWKDVYDEVRAMREACGDSVRMKTILAVGDLGSYSNVYAASMACMMGGADFIKTSTGKEGVNATLPASLVMTRAILDFQDIYHIKVGFKPAGGLRTAADGIAYLALVQNVLGSDWMQPSLFRIGASSLLGNVEARLFTLVHGGQEHAPGDLTPL